MKKASKPKTVKKKPATKAAPQPEKQPSAYEKHLLEKQKLWATIRKKAATETVTQDGVVVVKPLEKDKEVKTKTPKPLVSVEDGMVVVNPPEEEQPKKKAKAIKK